MTEAEWLTADNTGTMFAALRRLPVPFRVAGRKYRLIACHFVRVVAAGVPDQAFADAVEAAEQYADGRMSFRQAGRAVEQALGRLPDPFAEGTFPYGGWQVGPALATRSAVMSLAAPDPLVGAREAVLRWQQLRVELPGQPPRDGPEPYQVIRDVFGNPFRPVAFDPDWRTSAAVALARTMYEARDFAHLPILADALEDAGCDHPDVIAHCRDPHGVHVRGCWVVDGVLGKT